MAAGASGTALVLIPALRLNRSHGSRLVEGKEEGVEKKPVRYLRSGSESGCCAEKEKRSRRVRIAGTAASTFLTWDVPLLAVDLVRDLNTFLQRPPAARAGSSFSRRVTARGQVRER